MENQTTKKYEDLMNVSATRNITFPEAYERAMKSFVEIEYIPASIAAELKAKREFGLNKYGEKSFQSTISNALSTPIKTHLCDELIDAINYLLHMKFMLPFDTNGVLLNERQIHANIQALKSMIEELAL